MRRFPMYAKQTQTKYIDIEAQHYELILVGQYPTKEEALTVARQIAAVQIRDEDSIEIQQSDAKWTVIERRPVC